MNATYDSDADQCIDCAEPDRLFHHVAGQRDQARADLAAAQAREAKVRVVIDNMDMLLPAQTLARRILAALDLCPGTPECSDWADHTRSLHTAQARALDGTDGGA